MEIYGHRIVVETVEWGCSDQIPQQRSAIRTPPMANWEEGFTRSLLGESSHRTFHPADLLVSTMSKNTVAEPKQASAGTGWISWLTSDTSGTILYTEENSNGLHMLWADSTHCSGLTGKIVLT